VEKIVAERRGKQRHSLRIPLQVRLRGSEVLDQMAESVDISACGVLVETGLPLRVGSVVDMRLEFRGEVTGTRATKWRCWGRVVRVVHHASQAQPMRAGVRFDQVGVLRAGSL